MVGFAVLLFGRHRRFGELQAAFERLWLHGADAAKQKWWHGASLRLRGVGYVLAFGFLLLVSLVISTLLNLASGWAGSWFALEQALRVLNEVVGLRRRRGAILRLDAHERRAPSRAGAAWRSAP